MRVFYLAATTSALLAVALPAQALPLLTGPDIEGAVTPIRDDCGPFGHRSHYGYCKDNLHPELTYEPGEDRRGGYEGYGYRHGPRFYGEDGSYERRCFIRETYDGPVRICR